MASLTTTTSLENIQTYLKEDVLDTVQTYFEVKILENGTLHHFLLNRIHELFHYFKRHDSCCRKCCKSLRIQGILTEDQFKLLYSKDPLIQSIHEKRDKGRITIHCICPITPNNTTNVTDLDFTLINCLIKTYHQTPAGDPKWLEDILKIRNHLSHLGDPISISDQKLEKYWAKLENATTNIAGTIGEAYKKGVKRRIAKIRTNESQLEEFKKALNTRDGKLEQKITEALHNIENRIGGLHFQIPKPDFLKEQPKIDSAVTGASAQIEPTKCIVVWKFSNPGNWIIGEMQRKLECLRVIGDFIIQFVYQGSLIIHTEMKKELLLDEYTFKDVVEEFLLLFVKRLKLSGKSCISVDLKIWSNLEQTRANKGHASAIEEQENAKETQAHALENKLPSKVKYLCRIPAMGEKNNCTVVGSSLLITENTITDMVVIDAFDEYVRHISQMRIIYRDPEVSMPVPLARNRREIVFVRDFKDLRAWNVTSMDSRLVAVTVGQKTRPFNQTEVFVIDIISDSVKDKFSIDEEVYGLDFYEEQLYLGCTDTIKVMDIRGQTIKTLPIQHRPLVIKLNGDRVYYSDSLILTCCDLSGNQLWRFKDPIIKHIGGLANDEEGNIYITGTETKNIVAITSDGTDFRELSESFGLSKPSSLCYYKNTLIVCDSNVVVLLRIDDQRE